MTVLHSPGLTQVIQGVGFIRFGEEGIRDSYPIHFDYCLDSANSVISKNTIRSSNQRCIVIDASNNVVVEGNVAFDTKGHCFVVETGMESGNVFKSNLGAFTQKVHQTMPQAGISGKETDDIPAVFWAGSPSNYWIENVAAGSEGYGYWLELRQNPRGPHADNFARSPAQTELTQFSGNSAHSMQLESLKVTGYLPTKTSLIENFRSYLNEKGHFSVHKSSNMEARGTILDSPLESNPFPMSGTTVVSTKAMGNDKFSDEELDSENHGHASEPTDVFNLQASPSLLEK